MATCHDGDFRPFEMPHFLEGLDELAASKIPAHDIARGGVSTESARPRYEQNPPTFLLLHTAHQDKNSYTLSVGNTVQQMEMIT